MRSSLAATILILVFFVNARADSIPALTDSISNMTDTVRISKSDTTAPLDTLVDEQIAYPEMSELALRKKDPNGWLFFVSCLALLLYGLNRVINIKRHDKLVFGSLSGSSTKSNEGVFFELSVHQLLALPVLSIVFGIAVYVWLPLPVSTVFSRGVNLYLFITSIILLIYCFKFFFYYLVINVLRLKEVPTFFVNNILMITYSAAVFALPLIMVNIFSPYPVIAGYAFWMTIVSFVVFFLVRLYRITIAVASSFPYSIFYLFLYLCCLEILPWMILFKAYGFWV